MKKTRKRFICITGVVAGCLLLLVSYVVAATCGCKDTGPYFCLQDTTCWGCDAPSLPGADHHDCPDRDESQGSGNSYWACGYTTEEDNNDVCTDQDPVLCFVIKSCVRNTARYNEVCGTGGGGTWDCSYVRFMNCNPCGTLGDGVPWVARGSRCEDPE